MTEPKFLPGSRVRSPRFGLGTLELDRGITAIVRFERGLEECEKKDLQSVSSISDALSQQEWDIPLEVINRLQGDAIQSVNDTWGVFSRSRIELLPHQLWVCYKVNQKWPIRWLVADDVGLGKSIEAGMILWPLLARGTVKRLLILCPAHLVEQWQYRLRTTFDIRVAQYSVDADTDKSDFWGTHPFVVASLQTLRLDNDARQRRLTEADPWDLVFVDEAHHLNADEEQGPTLGYQLVKRLEDNNRIKSIVFFTGTPHRGKNFGFIALLHLLRPDLFDPRKPLHSQLPFLSEVMIRNNKTTVTDLNGKPLFTKQKVESRTYGFSREEDRFYKLMSRFIIDGQAYASGLGSTEGRAVILVLIAMQKLTSSSTAAIRRAIKGRLDRLRQGLQKLQNLHQDYLQAETSGSLDEVARLEEKIVQMTAALKLMENEEPRLRELLIAADQIAQETKIQELGRILETDLRDRTVLFFTEYKATQALLVSELMRRFGTESTTFINGDDRLEDVMFPDGHLQPITLKRDAAAERFNEGKVRFLVSTEAGGEGIDLQENCYTLVHVDLPWNPMRLHQRVGRLSRHGQKHRVEVLSLRNPDTVESLIWEKLNEKLEQISLAFSQVMDEPEDLLQLVLGMTSPSTFNELFGGAPKVSKDSLSGWFDQKTAHFGTQDVVETVRELVGNAAKFDFKAVSNLLPKVDLPDLAQFLEVALMLNGRRWREETDGYSFLTPDAWKSEVGVLPEYRGMRFDRSDRSADASRRLLGVGHKIIDEALKQARGRSVTIASLPSDVLNKALVVFNIRDRVTNTDAAAASMTVGVECDLSNSSCSVMKDWQVLRRLNELPLRKTIMKEVSTRPGEFTLLQETIDRAEAALQASLSGFERQFRVPFWELSGVLWPDVR